MVLLAPIKRACWSFAPDRMVRKEIDKNWNLRNEAPTWEPIPVNVPGDLYSDLLAEGIIDDPYYRDNELEALKLSDLEFSYETRFDAGEDILQKEHVELVTWTRFTNGCKLRLFFC